MASIRVKYTSDNGLYQELGGQGIDFSNAPSFSSPRRSSIVKTVFADFTVDESTEIYLISSSLGITGTLPNATSVHGNIYEFKKVVSGSTTIKLQPSSSQLIDGEQYATLTFHNETCRLLASGSSWFLLSSGSTSTAQIEAAGAAMLNTAKKIIHISSAGSDSNDGTTAEQAVATFARASELSPDISTAPVVWKIINSGTYSWSECKTQFVGSNGRWTLFATPETRITSLTGSAGVGSSAISIFGTGFTENQYQGHILEITSGVASGSLRTIQQNTATEILPVLQFEKQTLSTAGSDLLNVSSGDTYKIYRPGVVISGLSGSSYKKILMRDISFASLTDRITFDNCEILGHGVEIRGTTNAPVFNNCVVNFGMWGIHSDFFFTRITSSFSALFDDFELSTIGTGSFVQNCGMGLSFPDLNSGSQPSISLAAFDSRFQTFGYMPNVALNSCNANLGGYFRGLINNTFGTLVFAGRSRSTSVMTGSVFREGMILSNLRCSFQTNMLLPIQTNNRIALQLSDNATISMANNLIIDTTTSATDAIRLIIRSTLNAVVGNIFITGSAATSAEERGLIDIAENCNFIQGAGLYAHNTSTKNLIDCRGYYKCNSTTVLSGVGGVLISRNGTMATTGSFTLTGPLIVDGGNVQVGAAFSVTNPNDAIVVKNCGTFAHFAGVLSASSTSDGDGMKVEGSSRARLLGTTNVILIGSGSNKAGLRAKSGSSVWFSDAPSSVQGPSSKDLIIGTTISGANSVLSADELYITDGAGTTIGRSS